VIVASSVVQPAARLAGSRRQGLAGKARGELVLLLGMLLAHLGVAVFIVGVTLVKGYESEQDVRLDVGQTMDAGGYASSSSRRSVPVRTIAR